MLSPLICFVLYPHVLPLCDVSDNKVMLCYVMLCYVIVRRFRAEMKPLLWIQCGDVEAAIDSVWIFGGCCGFRVMWRLLWIQYGDVEVVVDSVQCGGCCGFSMEMLRLWSLCDVEAVVDSVWR